MRIDEITIHPRDNAMILATHGRAIWILDHLEPIQEYAAAMQTTADARLFTPPPFAVVPAAGARSQLRVLGRPDVLRREPAAGRGALVVQQEAGRRREAADHRRRRTRSPRDLGPGAREAARARASSRRAGTCACSRYRRRSWSGGRPSGRRRPGGQPGEWRRRASRPAAAQNPFGAGCGGAGGGGGGGGFGGFGGGGATPGPYVLPGVYNVSLIVDGKTLDTKPLRVMADKEVVLTEVERKRLFDMAMELHGLQRRANDASRRSLPVTRQLPEVRKQVADSTEPARGREGAVRGVRKGADRAGSEVDAAAAAAAVAAGGGRGGADQPDRAARTRRRTA